MYDEKLIQSIVSEVIKSKTQKSNGEKKGAESGEMTINVGVSQRHVHLCQSDLETLFGEGFELSVKKVLMGKEFASNELVTLVGPSLKAIENVRVLGPVRKKTQVEISRTDTFILKVSPPVRPSGEVENSERIVIVGPKGSVYLKEGVIIANRHIHLSPEAASGHGVKDGDFVNVRVDGEKPTLFYDVQIRVRDDFQNEMHIDTDDANCAGLKNGNAVTILAK